MDAERVRADLLYYEVDLPEAEHLDAELRVWKTKWSSVPSEVKVPSTVEDTLKSVSRQELLFPNVLQVRKLLLVTPVTTASVERANSALGFAKSDHRSTSTMSEGRLNALLHLYVHKDIQLDFEEVVTTITKNAPYAWGNFHALRNHSISKTATAELGRARLACSSINTCAASRDPISTAQQPAGCCKLRLKLLLVDQQAKKT